MTLTPTLAHQYTIRNARIRDTRRLVSGFLSYIRQPQQQVQKGYYHTTKIYFRDGNSHREHLSSSRQPSSMVLYDSLTQTFKAVPMSVPSNEECESSSTQHKESMKEKGIAWYTCGPTTYAPAHLGHGRTYVCLDIIRRIMEYTTERTNKTPPLFVMNITNVDDKILTAASEAGVSPLSLAQKYETEFWSDWDALGCLRPHVVTRVTDHVESDIIPYIDRLVKSNMAYALPNDGVYFDVKAYEDKMGHLTKYGKLAPPAAATDFFSTHRIHDEIPISSSIGESNGNSSITATPTKKRDLRDFVLWKNRKEGESLFWSSPWGDGRPGWHIECSAMIESVQKQFEATHTFQIHAGGIDLKFPHHTNEIAQSEAYHYPRTTYAQNKQEWIPHWVHTGHLHISGLKMSKSLKNFITIQEMLSSDNTDRTGTGGSSSTLSSPADDFRLWCLGLSGSYRGPATYSKDRLDQAKVVREKIVRFLLDAQEWTQRRNSLQSSSIFNKWRDQDQILFRRVIQAQNSCHNAIAGRSDSDHLTQASDSDEEDDREMSGGRECGKGGFDFNGSMYLDELVAIADAGSSYLNNQSTSQECDGPVQPVQFAVKTLRDLLVLVGFSNRTVLAGIQSSSFTSDDGDTNHCNVLGGERALVEELVGFRHFVRKTALDGIRDNSSTDNMKKILNVCDDLRDDTLPRMGIQIADSTVDEKDNPTSSTSPPLLWKTCIPQSTKISMPAVPPSMGEAISVATDIPVEDMFRVGNYEGMFSEYDDDGIPTRNADGSELSKRLLKKLKKKREKTIKRRQI